MAALQESDRMLRHLLLGCWAQLSGPLNVLHKVWVERHLFTLSLLL